MGLAWWKIGLVARDGVVAVAFVLVGDADLDGVEGAEHVELGDDEVGQAVDLDRVAHDDAVVPAGASLSAGGGAVLVADLDEAPARSPPNSSTRPAARLIEIGHEYGTTTGRERRAGWYDGVIVRYAVEINGLTDLIITKLDVLSAFDTIKVCVAYEHEGHRYNTVPCHQTVFHHAKPIYEELPGWNEDITHCRTFDELPKNARDYITFIEDLADVPVSMIAVGAQPGRDDHAALGDAPVACREGRAGGQGSGAQKARRGPSASPARQRAPRHRLPRLRTRGGPPPSPRWLGGCGAQKRAIGTHCYPRSGAGVGESEDPLPWSRRCSCIRPPSASSWTT